MLALIKMEWIFRMLFGFEIFNFIGGSIRWVLGTAWRTVSNKPKFTFWEYINGPKKSSDFFDEKGHLFVNILIFFLTLGITIGILQA